MRAGDCASRCQIYLRANDTDPSRKLQASGAGGMLLNISKGDYNIGLFQTEAVAGVETDEEGEGRDLNLLAGATSALMVQNHCASNFRFATVIWGGGTGAAPPLEVNQYDGQARVAVDAAPHVDGFQIMLGAGEARLYMFNNALSAMNATKPATLH